MIKLYLAAPFSRCSLSFAFRIGKFILRWTWGGYLSNTLKESGVTGLYNLSSKLQPQTFSMNTTADKWFLDFRSSCDKQIWHRDGLCRESYTTYSVYVGLFLNGMWRSPCKIWPVDGRRATRTFVKLRTPVCHCWRQPPRRERVQEEIRLGLAGAIQQTEFCYRSQSVQ